MTHPTRKPWADRLCAFARVSGPGIGRDGCGVSYYAVELREPVLAHWPWLDDVGRVEARILDHGRPVRLTAPLYAVALAFGLDVRADYAGDCVAELVDVRPVVAWPRPVLHEPRPSGMLDAWERVPVAVCDTLCGEMVSSAVVDRSRTCAVCGWMDEPRPVAQEVD